MNAGIGGVANDALEKVGIRLDDAIKDDAIKSGDDDQLATYQNLGNAFDAVFA